MKLLCLALLATSASAINYSWKISDFQGHFVDLHNGGRANFTPIHSFATDTGSKNQEWGLISNRATPLLYVAVNQKSSVGSQMAHTTGLVAGYTSPPGPPAVHAQVVGGTGKNFWWMLDYMNATESAMAGFRFIDYESGLALTAWPAKKGFPSSPLTLEFLDVDNEKQAFNLTCVENISFGRPCEENTVLVG
ncbi:hypothetical protein MKEN_00565300 [Mycena kentingensis (nom. inval.)]|nr:hypothetical protein MKEN_00565300 [Mycena kentingensis (nom. inval.)]